MAKEWRTTGAEVSAMSRLDEAAKAFMSQNDVPHGAVAVTRGKRLVFARAYSWTEPGGETAQPTSLFRIASCTKPITGIAIQQLVEAGTLDLTDSVQAVLGLTAPNGNALPTSPAPANPQTPGNYLGSVHIEHLLRHEGGWDRGMVNEPTFFFDPTVAQAFGKELPVTRMEIARWGAIQQTQFFPTAASTPRPGRPASPPAPGEGGGGSATWSGRPARRWARCPGSRSDGRRPPRWVDGDADVVSGVDRIPVARWDGFGTTIFAEMSALARAHRLDQPRARASPTPTGPAEVAEAAVAAIRAGHNQYPPGPGIPELRRAIADHQRRFYGLEYDPDTEVLVTAGATEAIAAALLALCEPGDEVVTVRAVLRLVRGGSRHGRGDERGGHAARPGLRGSIPTSWPPSITPADPARAAELAPQPDRQGLRTRRARGDRPALRRARPRGRHRRGVRAPGLRRRARPAGDAARHARAHGHDLLGGQDVLVHRLEDRLGVRAAAAASPPCARPSSSSPTSTARRSSTRSPGPALGDDYFADLADDLRGQARPAVRRPGGGRLRSRSARRARYFVTADIRPLGDDDGLAFCRSLPERCGVVAVPNVVFYDDVAAGRPLVRFAFCKRLEVLDEAVDVASRCRPERRDEGRRRPARHRVGGPSRQPSPALAPMIAAGRRCRRAARRADRDVRDRVLDGERPHRRAGRRPQHRVPRRPGRRARRRGCAARCPSDPTRARGRRSARPTASCSPARRRDAPLRQDPSVHLRRRARALRRRRPRTSPSTSRACGSACSSATTCASATSSGRWRPTPTATSSWPTGRRRGGTTGASLLQARAIENQAYVVGVNRVGTGDGIDYAGDS